MRATAMGKVTRDDQLSCSQLPALFGLDPYKTANDILRRCQNAATGGPLDDFTPNEAMGWGSRLEEAIVEEAAARLGMELQHGFTEPFQCLYAPLQCSLDAKAIPVLNSVPIVTDPDRGIFVLNDAGYLEVTSFGCLEAKLTSSAPESAPALHRGPLQLQGQMMCTGAKWGAVAVLYRGTEMRVFVFDRHEETQERIVQAAKDFECRLETYVRTGQADWFPLQDPADGARVFPESKKGEEIELPAEAARWIGMIRAGKEMIETGEAQVEAGTKELMKVMGQAEIGRYGSTQVVWGSRSYQAQPAKTVPAKDAYTVRNKSLTIKEAA